MEIRKKKIKNTTNLSYLGDLSDNKIIYVDTQNTGIEGVIPITDNSTPSNTNKYGVFYGNRINNWMIEDEAFFYSGRDKAHSRLINGYRWTGDTDNGDSNFPHYIRPDGYITLTPYGPYRYNFTRFYTFFRYDRSIKDSNHIFRISASNDGSTWDILKDFTPQSMRLDNDRNNVIGAEPNMDDGSRMYFTEWTNNLYYSMWRISHIDLGKSTAVGVHTGYTSVIDVNYCFSELEWG